MGRDGIKNSRGWNKITKQSKIDKDKERESKEEEKREGKKREEKRRGEKDRSKKIYCKWPRSWPFAVGVVLMIIMIEK